MYDKPTLNSCTPPAQSFILIIMIGLMLIFIIMIWFNAFKGMKMKKSLLGIIVGTALVVAGCHSTPHVIMTDTMEISPATLMHVWR